jgi:hypothetical protein
MVLPVGVEVRVHVETWSSDGTLARFLGNRMSANDTSKGMLDMLAYQRTQLRKLHKPLQNGIS